MEIWKDINNEYQVSNLGNVRNAKGQLLKPYLTGRGYLKVKLYHPKKQFLVHRLVAMAFCENVNHEKVVDHINGNKLDNRACNLEWVSSKENSLRASAKKLLSNKRKQIIFFGDKGEKKLFPSVTKAANLLNINRSSIVSALATGYKTMGGTWSYA